MTTGYSIVMRAYPKAYRAEHGDELVTTANELEDGWSFRQSWSLLAEGLRTRTRLAAGGSPKEVWASGVAFGIGALQLFWFTFVLLTNFNIDVDGTEFLPPRSMTQLVVVAIPLVAMTISTRWPTAVVSIPAIIAAFVVASRSSDQYMLTGGLVQVVALSTLLVWLASRTSGPRAFSPIVAIATIGVLVAGSTVFGTFLFVSPAIFALALLVFGLALATVDPRHLIVVSTILLFLVIAWTAELLNGRSPDDAILPLIGTPLLVGFILLARFGTRRALPA